MRNPFFLWKEFHNHLLTSYDFHLKNVHGNSFGWVFFHLLHSFGNFCNCSTWVGIYQLGGLHTEYHKPYMKKLNQAFAITIKRAVYHINFFGQKTFKSVSLFYLATSFTSALPQQNVLFSPISGCTLARTRWFLKLQPERNETNGAGVKTLLTFSSAYKNIIYFLILAFRLWKRGWSVTTRGTPVSFLLGLSNNSFKSFSETILIWASTTFCGYRLLQNLSSFQVFKVFLEI